MCNFHDCFPRFQFKRTGAGSLVVVESAVQKICEVEGPHVSIRTKKTLFFYSDSKKIATFFSIEKNNFEKRKNISENVNIFSKDFENFWFFINEKSKFSLMKNHFFSKSLLKFLTFSEIFFRFSKLFFSIEKKVEIFFRITISM